MTLAEVNPPQDGRPPAAQPAPRPDSETVRFLCELAVKRHDIAERSFDALNTRLGALVAFNSFLFPASITLFRALSDTKTAGSLRNALFAVWLAGLATATAAGLLGFTSRKIKSIPDPLSLYEKHGASKVADAATATLGALGGAWETITDAMRFKSVCLNVALFGVVLELLVLAAALLRIVVSL